MRICAATTLLLAGAIGVPWALAWQPDDGRRTIHVFVKPGLADEVEVEEWTELPLEQRRHPDGTLEYFGKSAGRASLRPMTSDGKLPKAYGDAGVRVSGLLRQPLIISENTPVGHEVVVELAEDDLPRVET